MENPAKESRTKKERDAKRKRIKRDAERKAMGIIGRKEAKEKSIWKLDETQTKCVRSKNDSYLQLIFYLSCERFALFVPLHKLWLGYMSELLGLRTSSETLTASNTAQAMPSVPGMHAKLVKADFHGSIMTGVHPIISILVASYR